MNTTALISLWNLTQRHPGTSGARSAAAVLLGIYNGRRFPMNLSDLGLLDVTHRTAAFNVIEDHATSGQGEVQEFLNRITGRQDFGHRLEQMAHDLKLKGRCKREHLAACVPASLLITPQLQVTASVTPHAGK